MNILLTNTCQGKCPYCFASEYMYSKQNQTKSRELSLSNFEKILDFSSSNKNKSVRLLGGEPSLHTNLEEILKLIFKKGFKQVEFYSNGIINQNNTNILQKYSDRIIFIWNLNSPELYNLHINSIINKSISLLRGKSPILGFNIYQPDYDPSFIFKMLINNPHIKYIRIGIAHPIGNTLEIRKQKFIGIDDYPKAGNIIYKFCRKIYLKYPQIKQITLDCGYAPCMFTVSHRRFFNKIKIFKYNFLCSPDLVDITTNLTTEPCYTTASLDQSTMKLSDFEDIKQLKDYYLNQWIYSRKHLPLPSSKCIKCEFKPICFHGCGGERILLIRKKQIKLVKKLAGKKMSLILKLRTLNKIAINNAASYNFNQALSNLSYADSIIQRILNKKNYKILNKLTKIINSINKTREEIRNLLDFKLLFQSNTSKSFLSQRDNIYKIKRKYLSLYDIKTLLEYCGLLNSVFFSNHEINDSVDNTSYNLWKKIELRNFLDIIWNKKDNINNPSVIIIISKAVKYLEGKKEFRSYITKNIRKISA